MYKLLGTQLSLFTTFQVLFFQFVFVLPARCVRMRIFTGKSKQMQAVYAKKRKYLFVNNKKKIYLLVTIIYNDDIAIVISY